MERLRKRLYSNDQPDAEHNESSLSPSDDGGSPHRWKQPDNQKPDHSILDKFLLFAGIFCVLAAGFAAAVIIFGSSGVSPQNVDIQATGPNTISAGETANFDITVTNNNQEMLQGVSLSVEFPPGTRSPDGTGDRLNRIQRDIGNIQPGESSQVSVAASLFGEQDEVRSIDITTEYSVDDSNAIFSANYQYSTTISELPIAMSISSPEQTASGQPVTFDISVQSNSSRQFQNVIVRGDYPFGFTPTNISPEPDYRNNVWTIGSLEPGASRDISVTGQFSGGISSGQRTFRFSSGIASAESDIEIGTLFADRSRTLSLQEPLLGLSLDVGEETDGELVIAPRNEVAGTIEYQNNTDQTLRATEIGLQIDGQSIRPESVAAESGLYRQDDQRIIWNPQTTDRLEEIESGESGELAFSLETKTADDLVSINNPTVDLTVGASSQPPSGTGLPNPITSELTRTSNVLSDVVVTTESLRNSEVFSVSGPYPPEVDTDTDYVIGVSIANTSNQLSDVRFQAALPAYVEIAEDPQTTAGSFEYNDTIGRLRWSLDSIEAGAGYQAGSPEMYLPVTVRPTLEQEGSSPELLNNITLTAVDGFVGQSIDITDIDQPTTQADDLGGDSDGSVVDQ
jgi:hypothetical protein